MLCWSAVYGTYLSMRCRAVLVCCIWYLPVYEVSCCVNLLYMYLLVYEVSCCVDLLYMYLLDYEVSCCVGLLYMVLMSMRCRAVLICYTCTY